MMYISKTHHHYKHTAVGIISYDFFNSVNCSCELRVALKIAWANYLIERKYYYSRKR